VVVTLQGNPAFLRPFGSKRQSRAIAAPYQGALNLCAKEKDITFWSFSKRTSGQRPEKNIPFWHGVCKKCCNFAQNSKLYIDK
jgi:hypothetical protein